MWGVWWGVYMYVCAWIHILWNDEWSLACKLIEAKSASLQLHGKMAFVYRLYLHKNRHHNKINLHGALKTLVDGHVLSVNFTGKGFTFLSQETEQGSCCNEKLERANREATVPTHTCALFLDFFLLKQVHDMSACSKVWTKLYDWISAHTTQHSCPPPTHSLQDTRKYLCFSTESGVSPKLTDT